MTRQDVVVCSFYTDDEYYRACAERLRANLDELGISAELEAVHKADGEDWADICRKKIGFLARVCEQHPDKAVFWSDVDCQLLSFPEYVRSFTADLIGFQRGFGSPLGIGYERRTRFWEPCFFGINTSAAARKFIRDAARIERTMAIKATDDYFLEESWRANAATMTFQVIPSGAVRGKGDGAIESFFVFGSSGNVAAFKGKVTQHQTVRLRDRSGRSRRQALHAAKALERRLTAVSQPGAARLRRWADASGITHRLVRDGGAGNGTDRHRARLVNQAVVAGQRGETARVVELGARVTASGIATARELAALEAADAFAAHAAGEAESAVPLVWWPRPFPGNFGDWLSPLILSRVSGRPVRYVAPTRPAPAAHLILIGSIARFVKQTSIVAGTGVSTAEVELNRHARYVSVRGPLTAGVVRASGGPSVESMGDPAVLLRRLLPVELGPTNGRLALVRHHTHADLPVTLPEDMDELSVLAANPARIEAFVRALARYEGVVTSAMHVMIVCHAYGIPCSLIGFRDFEDAVHGSGMKYGDYSLGIGLDTVWEPQIVPRNLAGIRWADRLATEKISEDKLDEIEAALHAAVHAYLDGRA